MMGLNIFSKVLPGGGKKYQCGTLTYTKAGLFALFAWLLWGDFCFTLMETVVPSIMPLKLKALNCPNWVMGAILATVPGILNITICPYVSFKSDRFRSRWGRRLPFIIGTLPFLCVSLVLLGCGDQISLFLQRHIPALKSVAPATLTISLIAVFMVFFQFFNMFVNSVFWYLFADVVPAQFLAKFGGVFQIVGTTASALYNYFIFRYAESHMREIFLGAALLYFIGFGLMCLRVKEGAYPALAGEDVKQSKGLAGIRTFMRECFSHKIYWLQFTANSALATGTVIWTFDVFFKREMGLTLDEIGKLGAIGAIGGLVAVYLAAVFVDRWQPLRVMVFFRVFAMIGMVSSWIWLFISLPGSYFFWLSLGGGLISSFQSAMSGAASYPAQVRLFPQSRFGQFCSAQSMILSILRSATGIIGGLFVDAMRWLCHGSDYAYRFNFVWMLVWGVIGAVLSVKLYIEWHRRGGDFHYHPPASWSPTQQEEMPVVATVPPQSRWLNCSLYCFKAIMTLSLLGLPVLMWWMHHERATQAFWWFAALITPLSLAFWGLWAVVEKGIRRDMSNCATGKPLRNGIPHHGVLMAVSTKYLLFLALWVVQVVVAVNLKMEVAAIVFGLANVVTNFLLIGCVWWNCRIERGRCEALDHWPEGCGVI